VLQENVSNNISGNIFTRQSNTIKPMVEKTYFVYILTNWNNQVMYIGVTNNIVRRIYEHKNKLIEGFTSKYNISKLVYYESSNDIRDAITREKEIKKWRREKKNQLVETINPDWKELDLD